MATDPLVDPIEDGEHEEFAGLRIDLFQAGDARVKRLVYRPGGRWSEHVKPHVGTEFCEHAHVGFRRRTARHPVEDSDRWSEVTRTQIARLQENQRRRTVRATRDDRRPAALRRSEPP